MYEYEKQHKKNYNLIIIKKKIINHNFTKSNTFTKFKNKNCHQNDDDAKPENTYIQFMERIAEIFVKP